MATSIVTTMRYPHPAPHVARDAVRLLDRVPTSAPNLPGNPAPNSSPASAIGVEVTKDWRTRRTTA